MDLALIKELIEIHTAVQRGYALLRANDEEYASDTLIDAGRTLRQAIERLSKLETT